MAADLKRLKGTYDLAQLNHSSLQNDDSEAALEAAKSAYEAALEAADTDGNSGIVEEKAKAPTPKTGGAGSAKKKTGDGEGIDSGNQESAAQDDSQKKSD